jgi:hypothetical protein
MIEIRKMKNRWKIINSKRDGKIMRREVKHKKREKEKIRHTEKKASENEVRTIKERKKRDSLKIMVRNYS